MLTATQFRSTLLHHQVSLEKYFTVGQVVDDVLHQIGCIPTGRVSLIALTDAPWCASCMTHMSQVRAVSSEDPFELLLALVKIGSALDELSLVDDPSHAARQLEELDKIDVMLRDMLTFDTSNYTSWVDELTERTTRHTAHIRSWARSHRPEILESLSAHDGIPTLMVVNPYMLSPAPIKLIYLSYHLSEKLLLLPRELAELLDGHSVGLSHARYSPNLDLDVLIGLVKDGMDLADAINITRTI